jgi:hypothetical protein
MLPAPPSPLVATPCASQLVAGAPPALPPSQQGTTDFRDVERQGGGRREWWRALGMEVEGGSIGTPVMEDRGGSGDRGRWRGRSRWQWWPMVCRGGGGGLEAAVVRWREAGWW